MRFRVLLTLLLLFATGCVSQRYLDKARIYTEPAFVTVAKENHSWVLKVDGEPFFVKGVHYEPGMVGRSPEMGMAYWVDWAHMDVNGNGKPDGPYDAFVDSNHNGELDLEEDAVGDFVLMREMGVNTIPWYHNAYPGWLDNKDVLRDLYLTHGIRVAVGDLFGAFPQEQGYEWNPGTDYNNPYHRKVLLESVRKMVQMHKDEPYVLLWLLGYSNNFSESGTNAASAPEAYATLLNEAAALIHDLDKRHPVALVNGDLGLIEYYARYAQEIDILGVHSLRGDAGFGELWKAVDTVFDRPVLIAAYGGADAPAYLAEEQMEFHRKRWLELRNHRAGRGYGNAIGGIAFEWLDQWWRAGEPQRQLAPGNSGEFRARVLGSAEEWAGLWSQSNGRKSPFVRRPRLVYCMYQTLWNEDLEAWLPWCDTREELDAIAVRFERRKQPTPEQDSSE